MIAAILKGKDFEALFGHAVYGRIVDWLESRAEDCLREMRSANVIEDDRARAKRQLVWATTENLLHEFQVMVQDAIHEKQTVIQMIQERTDAVEGSMAVQ